MILNSNFYLIVLCHLFAMYELICESYSSNCLRVPISETMISTPVKAVNKFIFLLFVLQFQKLSIKLTSGVFLP